VGQVPKVPVVADRAEVLSEPDIKQASPVPNLDLTRRQARAPTSLKVEK
jgi:hypothetical protein